LTIIGIAMLVFGKIRSLGALGGFLWVFDITGTMSDVFSFMRIAGVGSATALLVRAFNSLIYSTHTSLASVNIVLAVVAGVAMGVLIHLFLFIMSPIGPFVHSMRLCFYEILTKFYEGGGRRLKPVRVVIKPKLTLARGK